MQLTEFIQKYIKRNNLLEDFSKIDQASGFNHRFVGKGTNVADKAKELTYDEKIALAKAMEDFITKATEITEEFKLTIKEPLVEFESLEGLKSLTEYHHAGGELVIDMPVLLEGGRRAKLTPGKLKSWVIGTVKNDLTGYGKYSASTIIAEVDGEEKEWPFSMVYYKAE